MKAALLQGRILLQPLRHLLDNWRRGLLATGSASSCQRGDGVELKIMGVKVPQPLPLGAKRPSPPPAHPNPSRFSSKLEEGANGKPTSSRPAPPPAPPVVPTPSP